MWRKIIGPTLFVVTFWLAFSGVVTVSMYWMGSFHSDVVEETGYTIQAANSLSDTTWKIASLALAATQSSVDPIAATIVKSEKEFDKHLDIAEKTSYTETEKGISKTIRQRYVELRLLVQNRLTSIRSQKPDNAVSEAELLAGAEKIANLCKELREFNENLARHDVERQGHVITFIAMAFLGILLVGTVGGVLWSIHTASEVGSSISKISITLGGADDQLKDEIGLIDLEASGDFGLLQKQVDMVTDRIRSVIKDLEQERLKTIASSRLAAAGELAAGVAHEIRNPLTSVKLLLHAAAENTPERTLSPRQLDAIQTEIARMEKTVQGLLDFAKPCEVHRMRHDLRNSLTNALHLVEGLAAKQSVVIRQDFPAEAVEVNADPGQLHQVFVNLLLNAIEAMPQGGELHVSIDRNGTSAMHRVTIADTGSGIPPHIMERLFEPFVTSKQRGTGLGLAISRRLVHEQSGELTAKNIDPTGALFAVELPPASAQETVHV